MAMTNSLWSDHDPAGHSTGGFSRDATWFPCALSTLDAALNNKSNVPANATITGLRLYVSAKQESAGANVYLKYGFGGTASIGEYLYGTSSGNGKSVGTSSSDHPSGGVDIIRYLNRTVQSDSAPFELSRSYGGCLSFRFISGNFLGKTYYIDSVKLDITYQAHGHSYTSTVTTQPTCTATGVRTYTCSCGHSYTETIPAKGHTEVTLSAVAPTCTATGLTAGKKCSVCGTVITAQQTVPAKGHSYTSQVIAATAAVDGYTLHTCQNGCGSSYKDNYTINKIFYGTKQPSKIFFGTQEVKEVYYGTTKVYGPK